METVGGVDMYLRQQDIFAKEKADTPITVVGAGSLGSWVVLGLAKLGFKNITVYDPDTVERHNIPNQFYEMEDADPAGKSGEEAGQILKVVALRMNVHSFTGIRIHSQPQLFHAQGLSEIMIVTPDNMRTRGQVMGRCDGNTNVKAFIDGRMGGQSYRVYTIDPNSGRECAFYQSKWYPDDEASEDLCTARGVGYNAIMCAMEIVNMTKRTAMGEECPKEIIADSGGLWRTVNW